MKKSLLALAALTAFAGAASAQSSVTLFGIVDAAVAYGWGSVADRNALVNSGYNSSRLGFRGVEDMGGGLRAGFWLEAGLGNDDGTGQPSNANNQPIGAFNPTTGANAPVRTGSQGLTFNRRSTVSVGGAFGELRLGRDYTPHFWNQTVYDVFGTNGVGTTQTQVSSIGGAAAVRASNSITYLYNHGFNATSTGGAGFHVLAQYYIGENVGNAPSATKSDGNGYSFRVGYGAGPFSAAFAYGKTEFVAGDISTLNFGGSFDFGAVRLVGLYDRDKVSRGNTGKGFHVGASVPLGQAEFKVGYSTYKVDVPGTTVDPKVNKIALGYVYNLSKRTALFTTLAQVSNSGGAASALNGSVTSVNGSSRGTDFGLRHVF